MSEPYDVTRPGDAARGLIRYCDRTGREWTVPAVVWWQGRTACDLCDKGKDGRLRSVVPIGAGEAEPILPLECPGCGNMSLHPV